MIKFKNCFTKKKVLISAAAIVVITSIGFTLNWWYELPGPDVPPYSVSFYFEESHSAWPSLDTTAYQENEPIIARGYAYKFHTDAPMPDMYGFWGQGQIHPFTFIIKDPDGLVFRWQNKLSQKKYLDELKRWQSKTRGIHFTFDLQDWVPEGFKWKAGRYTVSGFYSVARKRIEINGWSGFFMKEVPEIFRNPPADLKVNPATLFKPMLSAEIEANRTSYNVGDIITLRGYAKNISKGPFMIQTRYPFREIRLIALPGQDFFPNFKYSAPLRLSDFTKIEPGQQILLFEESFVAGQSDPNWWAGLRREDFPTPFVLKKYSVWFEMQSEGLFPSDRQPDVGIWTGKVKSNSIDILIKPIFSAYIEEKAQSRS